MCGRALVLDNRREEAAVASYLRQLKPIEPEQQGLRAHQIESRIYAIYMNKVTESIPLVP
jgi:hypothetical protein